MSCVSPITIHVNGRDFSVPCNHCIQCRITKISQIEFLCNKELLYQYSLGRGASFVTLTYDDNHIPINSLGYNTLVKSDVQKFLKRFRRSLDYHNQLSPFKVLYSGEYGDSFGRCHYHLAFLGVDDSQCRYWIPRIWSYGLSDIGVLTSGGLRYIVKYLSKSDNNSSIRSYYDSIGIELPFIQKSVKMGRFWIDNNLENIVDSKFLFVRHGKLTPFPKYVCNYVSQKTGVDYRPFISDFYTKTILSESINYPYSISDYSIEKSIIREKYLIDSLRSNGIVPTPEHLQSSHWIRPKHTRISPYSSSDIDLLLNT